jgi:Ribosomal protein S8
MVRNTISDAVTRIKNGYRANLTDVVMQKSKKVEAVMLVLAKYKYVKSVKTSNDSLVIELNYIDKMPVIVGMRNVSRPGQKVYVPYKAIPKVWGGLGINILSTSKGVMGQKEAKKAKLGGELLMQVW